MENFIKYVSSFFWDWPLIVTIFSTGIYYTLTCKFFQIKYFKHIFNCTIGNSESIKSVYSLKQKNSSTLTGLETFFTVIATTSGIGNITGVAVAIEIGGPGALFWLFITGIIGMIIKMAEVSLAVYYRDELQDGIFESSPMNYIEKGIGKSMNFGNMNIPIYFFCIGILFTLFINIQNYHASIAISGALGMNVIYISFVYAIILYFAISKGIKGLGRIFKILIPMMAILYIGAGIIVIILNFNLFFEAIKLVFIEAFNIQSILGGSFGAGISETVRQGVSRAVYSNEAGWGTTPMIHAKAYTDHPIKVGFWGALEVFFDTLVICSTTGIVMVISVLKGNPFIGNEAVIYAFSLGIGEVSKIFIPVMIFLFGLTTSIGWYSYYETILNYISRKEVINMAPLIKRIKYIYPIPGFIIALYFKGNVYNNNLLWNFSDILTAVPTFINIFSVLILSNKFVDLLNDYEKKYIKNEEIKNEEILPLFFKDEDIEYYDL